MLIELIALDEGMRHFYTFCLHRMLFGEVVVCDGVIIEVAYFSHF